MIGLAITGLNTLSCKAEPEFRREQSLTSLTMYETWNRPPMAMDTLHCGFTYYAIDTSPSHQHLAHPQVSKAWGCLDNLSGSTHIRPLQVAAANPHRASNDNTSTGRGKGDRNTYPLIALPHPMGTGAASRYDVTLS